MGLFDVFKGIFTQGEAAALPTLLSEGLAKTNLGDLQGLLDRLQRSGLGPQVQSWLGDGPNMPVSPELLKNALTEDHVQQLAQHFGIDPDAVLNVLSEHLPNAVDEARQQGIVKPS
ncbi:MAG: DUF937 domain-containing protein [Alphaproteobacteria bacterium]|nr:DUF937 domain-containing protein [Alphaproteobacteria bacterium]